jgi:hypothetical protein
MQHFARYRVGTAKTRGLGGARNARGGERQLAAGRGLAESNLHLFDNNTNKHAYAGIPVIVLHI